MTETSPVDLAVGRSFEPLLNAWNRENGLTTSNSFFTFAFLKIAHAAESIEVALNFKYHFEKHRIEDVSTHSTVIKNLRHMYATNEEVLHATGACIVSGTVSLIGVLVSKWIIVAGLVSLFISTTWLFYTCHDAKESAYPYQPELLLSVMQREVEQEEVYQQEVEEEVGVQGIAEVSNEALGLYALEPTSLQVAAKKEVVKTLAENSGWKTAFLANKKGDLRRWGRILNATTTEDDISQGAKDLNIKVSGKAKGRMHPLKQLKVVLTDEKSQRHYKTLMGLADDSWVKQGYLKGDEQDPGITVVLREMKEVGQLGEQVLEQFCEDIGKSDLIEKVKEFVEREAFSELLHFLAGIVP